MGEQENCSSTKGTLENFCVRNGLSYGTFWGFDPRNPMLLTLEDAYYEKRLKSAINNLLLKVHMLGEGTIGQAALNGKHQWVIAEECGPDWNSFGSSESKTTFQVDSEVRAQFSLGIKTIVAIPVEPRGVIQFGSTKKISESLQFVDQTVRFFREIHEFNEIPSLDTLHSSGKVESYDVASLFSSFIPSQNSKSKIFPCSDKPSNSNTNTNTSYFPQNIGHFEDDFQQSDLSTKSDFGDRGSCHNSWGRELPTVPSTSNHDFGVDSQFFHDSLDPKHLESNSLNVPENYYNGGLGNVLDDHRSMPSVFEMLLDDFKPEDLSTDLFNLCQADDLSQWLASSPDQNTNPTINASSSDMTHLVESTSVSCLTGGEIAINDPRNLVPEKSVIDQISEKDKSDTKKHNGFLKCASGSKPTSISGPRKGLFSELGLEEFLYGTNNTSCLTTSCSAKRRKIECADTSGNVSLSNNNPLTMKELPKSQVGLWIDDSYSITPSSSALSSKHQNSEERKRAVRKRARPGESTRPRPKDRQLIQDRIKELRGIIPNSGKCSIDSLLEQTIKYMVFLQGVTKHGDKIKQPTKAKLIGGENGVVLRDKNSMSSGATWAYEVGGQSTVCPIIVEDLSPPGQMLIEMLCEEQGFFLEIADIVRGFGLSILKGVMEVRGDKIWAHFIVEAKSHHTTRIDVFWSLVRLLQQTNSDAIDSDNRQSNGVFVNEIPIIESYQKPNLPPPICLTETLH